MNVLELRADDESRLVASLINGETETVALVRRWIRAAAGRYRRLLADDLEDLEQDTLVSLVSTLSDGSFRRESRLETYVSRMVHYQCIDRIRANSRRTWVDIDGLDLRAMETSALSQLEKQQDSHIALTVAARQPEGCRELWKMIYDGLSYAEMAERLNLSPGTLRVRVLRCRRKAAEERSRLLEEIGESS